MALLKTNKVYIQTHGGLGNQLFQIYSALIIADKYYAKVLLFHNNNYRHKFDLVDEFRVFISDDNLPFIFKLRLLKLLKRIGYNREYIKILGSFYLDGYFQDPNFYKKFNYKHKFNALQKIKNLFSSYLTLGYCSNNLNLLHLRLGDFFRNEKDKLEFIINQIKLYEANSSHIITNEEDYVRDIFKKYNYNFQLISTKKMNSVNLLFFIMQYRTVITNGSTIAFWASILGLRNLISTNDQNLLYSVFINE